VQNFCVKFGDASVFTVRRYASAVYAVIMCPSVCLSVCHNSDFGVLRKRLNLGSRKPRRTIAQDSSLMTPKISAKFLRFLAKNDPYAKIFKIMFQSFLSPYQSTLLCSNVVKFVRLEIGEILRYLVDKKQNFSCLSNCRYCADRAQNLQWPAPTVCPECSKFHQNRFTFGRVIAERVNTVQLPRRLNPIFGGSLASSRITMLYEVSNCLQTTYICDICVCIHGVSASITLRGHCLFSSSLLFPYIVLRCLWSAVYASPSANLSESRRQTYFHVMPNLKRLLSRIELY